jgi:hypothetical protein
LPNTCAAAEQGGDLASSAADAVPGTASDAASADTACARGCAAPQESQGGGSTLPADVDKFELAGVFAAAEGGEDDEELQQLVRESEELQQHMDEELELMQAQLEVGCRTCQLKPLPACTASTTAGLSLAVLEPCSFYSFTVTPRDNMLLASRHHCPFSPSTNHSW